MKWSAFIAMQSKGSLYAGQAQFHKSSFHRFTEIGHIFHNKHIVNNKNTFQVEIWPIFCLNDSETQERGL